MKDLHDDETRVTDYATGGQKGAKLTRLGAMDPVALIELARVAGMGAEKYDSFNYLKGFDYSLAFNAMMRHALLFWSGEDTDPESKLNHMTHAAWMALALVSFVERGLGTDDRFAQPTPLAPDQQFIVKTSGPPTHDDLFTHPLGRFPSSNLQDDDYMPHEPLKQELPNVPSWLAPAFPGRSVRPGALDPSRWEGLEYPGPTSKELREASGEALKAAFAPAIKVAEEQAKEAADRFVAAFNARGSSGPVMYAGIEEVFEYYDLDKPRLPKPFLGYGGTGDRSTRSDHENEVNGPPPPRPGRYLEPKHDPTE